MTLSSWTRSAAAECKARCRRLACCSRPARHAQCCTVQKIRHVHVAVRRRSDVPLAGLHVCPLSLSSPFVAKRKLSRVCRQGEDMRAFGETIGRHCRLPTNATTSISAQLLFVFTCRGTKQHTVLVLLTSAATPQPGAQCFSPSFSKLSKRELEHPDQPALLRLFVRLGGSSSQSSPRRSSP